MTDARMPERWLSDRRLLRLSDPAFRLFVLGLMWSVANRTDGTLYDDDLLLMPTVDAASAAELAKAGLWQRERDTWIVADFATTQTSADELSALEAMRKSARERKARERARIRARDMSRDSPDDGHGDAHRTGQDRQDRTGKGSSRASQVSPGEPDQLDDNPDDIWPETATPNGAKP